MDEQNSASEETQQKQQELTDAQIDEMIKNAEALAEENLKKEIAKVRALPAQRVLTQKQHEVLLLIKEEDLTEEDKTRIKWANLRAPKLRYTGTGYTIAEKKKVKVKRKLAKASRRANRA